MLSRSQAYRAYDTRNFSAKLSICLVKPNMARQIYYSYITNGNFIELAKVNKCPDSFQSLS